MIDHEVKYKQFIKQQGVGSNDKVADSVKSYLSYLRSVCRHLNINISANNLRSEHDIQHFSLRLKGKVSEKTISNYGSAMKQYIKMVQELDL